MKDCTFSPDISPSNKAAGRSLSPPRSGPIFEELYKQADERRTASAQVQVMASVCGVEGVEWEGGGSGLRGDMGGRRWRVGGGRGEGEEGRWGMGGGGGGVGVGWGHIFTQG